MSRSSQRRSRPASRTPVRSRPGSAPGALPADPRASALAERLRAVSLRDEDRLRRRLAGLARRPVEAFEEELPALEQQTVAAEQRVTARAASVPALRYPEQLPVSQEKDRIAAALRDHQVIVVAGETGSGKTTQLPKICLEIGRGLRGRIGHTQPRRIAARAVAERVAEELGTELGGSVGYAVRFTDTVGEDSLVKVMTDGILLAEIQRDPELLQYDTLIVDEAHERSLTIDFLLGYLARLLPRRPELKLVITSATIDPERFSRHFGGAPILEVSGRTYPVEVRYRPLLAAELAEELLGPADEEEGDALDERDDLVGDDRDQTEGILDAVRELAAEGPGDVLVFLPGEREIRDTADALADLVKERGFRGTEILPLFARLSAEEQHRVFRTAAHRRIVLATNVAETSLTVPGIRYVVDAGTARISRYSHRTKVQRLPIERISQASANQRAGRCGRVADGICIRLYSQSDFESRPEFTDPEILRTNLAAVILQMTSLGLGDIAAFPFVEPPEPRAITDGLALLAELGALEDARPGDRGVPRLTPTGRDLARLPIDPRLGRMVLEAQRNGCLHDVLVVVAALSVQDPRERPLEKREQAAQLHARFRHEQSDFLTYLNLWSYLQHLQRDLSSSAFRRRVKAEMLHFLRIREWQDTYSQLRRVTRDLRFSVEVREPAELGEDELFPAPGYDADAVHRSLLAGLLGNIGLKDVREDTAKAGARTGGRRENRPTGRQQVEYTGARGAKFAVSPGSSLGRRSPDWVVAGELVETSRLWARVVAAIDPRWIEPLAAHVVRRSYSEPRWSRKRAAVIATERVTLYGVPIVAGRSVPYGGVDPELARDLFIRHALVEGDFETRHEFFHRNRELLAEAEELEHRARRRDIVVDDEVLFAFYDARVPADVVSGRHFDAWWKDERRVRPDLLTFDPAMLVTEDDAVSEEQFPRVWRQGDLELALDYVFDPGSPADGLTVDVPVEVVNRFDDRDLLWQVPGFRHDLVTAMIRALPKELRKNLAPAPDKAARFLERVRPHVDRFWPAFEAEMPRLGDGTEIYAEDVDWTKVPAHLRPTFRVLAGDGSVLAAGKDFPRLRASLETAVVETLAAAADDVQRTGATSWADLPEEVPPTHTSVVRGSDVTSYPALVDEGTTVGLRTFPDAARAAVAHREGVLRLLVLALPSPARRVQDALGNDAKLLLARAPHADANAVVADCAQAAAAQLLDEARGGEVRTAGEFGRLLERVSPRYADLTATAVERTLRVLRTAAAVEKNISRTSSLALVPSLADVREQFTGLVHAGFVAETGVERLPDLLRYLQGIDRRLATMPENPQRDRVRMAEFARVREEHRKRLARAGSPVPPELARIRWTLEELRLQKFAPGIPTAHPVSDERVLKALAEFS
ncbi:ATP-dependent helicase HrpA [Kineococcus radiotolerans]|uniref:ATP-dependent helicase HrpA n=1 Tax=Kineococcus radiotolerans TaxID=131568 RepID=A0A7W4TQD2_KINRA|nr:ATP-dependent RNA helicase HrpA [Kineococcus radiotolerans]MBB2902758.1 ATP-dependent helicase HrpA [Kineococcus radiotolerans]